MRDLPIDLLDQQLAANLRGDFEEGWRISQQLERERPDDLRAMFNRGWHLMRFGDLQKGFESFEGGRKVKVFGLEPPSTTIPRWSGKEDIQGKTVLLYGEGGFGDEILNVRFASLLARRGARVVVSCQPSLISVFKRVEGVADAVTAQQVSTLHYDYWVPAMSAPLPLGLTFDTLPNEPYIKADPFKVAVWREYIVRTSKPGDLKIGIRWSGNPKFEHEQHRRFPPEPLFTLSQIPGVSVYSLQRDTDLRDLPPEVTDLQSLISDWEETAAAIENLDIVISSCTSIAHLAGAMGKETWIIVPVLPYYTWAQPGEKTKWYKTARIFRQEVFNNWDTPLTEVRSEVEKRVGVQELSEQPRSQPTQIPKIMIPGLYFAPAPSVSERKSEIISSPKTLHFVAGLPRTGSTALISLLAQNPRIYGAPLSGLCGIFAGIYGNWEKNEAHQEYSNAEAKGRVLKSVLESYHRTERPTILDKNRQWVMYCALLEELLERPIKIIVPVRPLPEILASFEVLRRANPFDMTLADETVGETSTIAARASFYASPTGPVGMAYNALKDAVIAGYLDRMLFVDYNKLTGAPKMQLKRIYEFLEEPYFEHDFGHIEQIAQGDSWRAQKLPGLHDIRPEFKKIPKSAREILGPDVYMQYDQGEPWSSWT